MKYYCDTFFLVISLLFFINTALCNTDVMLRTIHTYKKYQHTWRILFSEHGFVLHSVGKTDKHCVLRTSKSLIVRYSNGDVYINGTRIHDADVYIYPISGTILCDGQQIHALRVHQWPAVGIALASYGIGRGNISMLLEPNWSNAPLLSYTLPDISFLNTQTEDTLALKVRVLLDEKKNDTDATWKFTAPQGFTVFSAEGDYRKKMVSKTSHLVVTHKNGHWYVYGKRIRATCLFLESVAEHISFEGNTYKGLLWLVKQDDRIMVINCLDIEDYVYSVLRTESWPGWPLEVNKVLAIASRTYVVSMVLNAKKTKRPYHVKNTNEHQTYSGIHSSAIIKCAVEETRGMFLSYDNKPIVAMFDSCCGGVIPAHIHGVNFDDAPYLAREYACIYCKRCKIYSWAATYSINELELLVQKQIPTCKKLHAITIAKHDKAGLVQEAIAHGSDKSVLTGKKLYSLIPGVKSFCFSVKKDQKNIIFNGRGYGHHLGLCQWGAREMVRDGWDYKTILQFYYPNTEFMRLM